MTPAEAESPYSECRSVAELLFVTAATVSVDFAVTLCKINPERGGLMQVVKELRRAGARDLAAAILPIAKAAPRDRRPLWQRSRRPGVWRCASAVEVIKRRRAERRTKQDQG